jgi:phage-related protein
LTVFELMGKIVIENNQALKAIDETNDGAKQLADSLGGSGGVSGMASSMGSKVANVASKVGTTVANAAKVVGKTVLAGTATAAAGITALTKQAVSAYADHEQLVGGVETLFKDSADTVKEYADEAFKTAGLSANEYMETVTGFSASLLQSLDGDTAQAADIANRTIIDMADNANKMGTDLSAIQTTYAGFSKQNYTMLDNLKLGYGGTKAEMQRLLDDANKINEEQGVHTDYQLENFADITEAIHVVQTEMGITGTTAKEASTTISGSLQSVKSSWQNLLVGLGDEDADLGGLISNLITSGGTFAENLVPRIGEILGGIKDAIPQIAQQLAPMLSEGLSGALSLIGIDVSPEQISNTFSGFIGGVKDFFTDNFPKFEEIGGNLKESISVWWGTMSTAFSEIDWAGAFSGLTSIVEGITGAVSNFLTADSDTFLGKVRDFSLELAALPINALDAVATAIEDIGAAFEVMEGIDAGKIDIGKALAAAATDFETDGKTLTERAGSLTQQMQGLLDDIDMGSPSFENAMLAGAKAADYIIALFNGALDEIAKDINRTANTITDLTTGEEINKGKNNAKETGNINDDAATALKDINAERSAKGAFVFSDTNKGSAAASRANDAEHVTNSHYDSMQMNADGAIFSKATIFGRANGKLQVAGEAGAEAVAPIDVLQGYVSDAVASQLAAPQAAAADNTAIIVETLHAEFDRLIDAFNNIGIKINNREFGRLVNGGMY